MSNAPNTNHTGLGDFYYELSSYQHPQNGRIEFCYLCSVRHHEVHLIFNNPVHSQDDIRKAMRYALVNKLDGVEITRPERTPWNMEFKTCVAKPFKIGAFNAEYRTIDVTQLTTIFSITHNIDVVTFEGNRFVHKYMWEGSRQWSFEREFKRYEQLKQCKGVPSLEAVVKREGMIRGLLISFIDGENLANIQFKSKRELLEITYRIIKVAAGLEKVGYYNEDLKCQNIVRRRSDGAIYFIDFAGGLTDGFYPEESNSKLYTGEVSPKDGIYILGKTLWQLWTNDIPARELPDSIPEPARNIINDCCVNRIFGSIRELQDSYCPVP